MQKCKDEKCKNAKIAIFVMKEGKEKKGNTEASAFVKLTQGLKRAQ